MYGIYELIYQPQLPTIQFTVLISCIITLPFPSYFQFDFSLTSAGFSEKAWSVCQVYCFLFNRL